MLQRYKHNKSIGQVDLTDILKKVWYAVIYFQLFVVCAYVVADSNYIHTVYIILCMCKCMLLHKFCNTSGPCQTIPTSKMKAWHLKHSSAQT